MAKFTSTYQLRSKGHASSVKKGRRVYAVGDIHGHLAELEELLDWVEADLADHDGTSELVFLGDYIDRGPDSRGVLKRLAKGKLPGDEHHFLKGNHEAVLLDILEGRSIDGRGWLRYGGREMLESYGVSKKEIVASSGTLAKLLFDVMPNKHVEFLKGLKTAHQSGDYLFVHAGVRPGKSLKKQKERDLLWIRDSFLASRKDHGKVVVHGHSIEFEPTDAHNRVGIDTGCYAGGALTVVRLERDTRHFHGVPQKS